MARRQLRLPKEGIQVGTAVALLVKGRTAVPAVMQEGSPGETPGLRSDKTGETPVLRLSGETPDLLFASAALGRQVAVLLDAETPVPGVTCGTIRPELKAIGVIARVDGKSLNPDAGDLDTGKKIPPSARVSSGEGVCHRCWPRFIAHSVDSLVEFAAHGVCRVMWRLR